MRWCWRARAMFSKPTWESSINQSIEAKIWRSRKNFKWSLCSSEVFVSKPMRRKNEFCSLNIFLCSEMNGPLASKQISSSFQTNVTTHWSAFRGMLKVQISRFCLEVLILKPALFLKDMEETSSLLTSCWKFNLFQLCPDIFNIVIKLGICHVPAYMAPPIPRL